MKLGFIQKLSIHKSNYKNEIRDELKNNSIVLSFALSIIVVGIFSVFYQNSTSLLIGIAISSLLLTLIQCFSNGNTMLNILPIFTLLVFGFFQKSLENIPVINILLKEQYSNLIIFISFSLTFLTQAYKNIIFKNKVKNLEITYNVEKNKMIYAELDVIKNIKEKANKIRKISEEKGLYDLSFNKAIGDLIEYVDNETFLSNVKSTLISKGNDEEKTTFNIDEIEESIMLNCGISRNREIHAKKQVEEE
jgi:hypothetical protein